MTIDYKRKYLKYKEKYLNFGNKMYGGDDVEPPPAEPQLLEDLKNSIFKSEIKEIEEIIKEYKSGYKTLLETLKVYDKNKDDYTKADKEKEKVNADIKAAEEVTEKAKENEIVAELIKKVEEAKNALEKAKNIKVAAETAAKEATTAAKEAATAADAKTAAVAKAEADKAQTAAATAATTAAIKKTEAKTEADKAATKAATAEEKAATEAKAAEEEAKAPAEALVAATAEAKAAAEALAAATAEAKAIQAKKAAEDAETRATAQAAADAAKTEAEAKAKAAKAKAAAAATEAKAAEEAKAKAAAAATEAKAAKTAVLATAKIPNLVEKKFNEETIMEIARQTVQPKLTNLKNTLLKPDGEPPGLKIPESKFKTLIEDRIKFLPGEGGDGGRVGYIFKMDQILKEIIVFFNGIQILKEYEEISELLEQLKGNDYKKIISNFKNNTSSLIRQMPDKSNDLSSTLDTWLINKNEIKKFNWDSYKKAIPVLKKVEQLREKYRTFWENLSWSSSLKKSFIEAIDGLKTPTLDLEDTKKLLENETTKINNQIDQMVDFIDDTKNKQYAQKLRYLNNLKTLRNIDTDQTLNFSKLLDREEDIKREIKEAKITEITDTKDITDKNKIPESLDENNPELAQKISDGSKILEQLVIDSSYKINNDEINNDKINKIHEDEDTVVNKVYTALKIEEAGNIFSEKEKKECKTHIRNMVKSVNNRFDEEQVN